MSASVSLKLPTGRVIERTGTEDKIRMSLLRLANFLGYQDDGQFEFEVDCSTAAGFLSGTLPKNTGLVASLRASGSGSNCVLHVRPSNLISARKATIGRCEQEIAA